MKLPIRRCYFCEKNQDEVRKLVAGAYALICDECIVECVKVISGQVSLEVSGQPAKGGE